MKALITSQFFCSYFYHSAIPHWEKVQEIKEAPDVYYHGITAIILFQSTLESYINFLIYDSQIDTKKVKVDRKERKLIDLSIKRKWIEFPKVVASKTFNENEQPYLDFQQLVDVRNKLIHFKTRKMDIEVQLPKETMTVGEVRNFLGQPGALSGHILMDILPVAIAGRTITEEMIRTLHKMLKTDPPRFLTDREGIIAMRIVR